MKIREVLLSKKGIQKYHKHIRSLDVILLLGLIAHSIILLIINKSINPTELMGIWNEETMHMRLCWRQCAEIIFATGGLVYCVGLVIVLWKSTRKRVKIPLKDIVIYLIMQIIMMFLSTVPFGLVDIMFFDDYIFPVWGTTGILILIFAAYTILSSKNQDKEQ